MTFRDYESELREAGWKPHMYRGKERLTMWVDPEDGKVYRGPYFAWRLMESKKQWPEPMTISTKCLDWYFPRPRFCQCSCNCVRTDGSCIHCGKKKPRP